MDFVKNSKDEKLIKIFKNYEHRVESKFKDFHLHYDILINWLKLLLITTFNKEKILINLLLIFLRSIINKLEFYLIFFLKNFHNI